MYFSNYNLSDVVSPVQVDQLEALLTQTKYDKGKAEELIDGFKNGFDIGYRGPEKVQQRSPNLKLVVGSLTDLWNKVMKEVQLGRYAGPYSSPPFKYFIQSPIGLVPKDHGTKTRLIFHLSYPKRTDKSVNANTPQELKSVSYQDFDAAVRLCLAVGAGCFAGKSDLTSAFRHLGIKKKHWKFLVMKAKSPRDGKFYYFVDKCLPFGVGISCSHFQAFSDALAHIARVKNNGANVNYLDDFFFVALLKQICDHHISTFLRICEQINFPVSLEKTQWGTTRIIFLGLLIDTKLQIVCVRNDKVETALQLIKEMLQHPKRKTTLRKLQKLCGFLNFLCKSIIPGRVFTRRLYSFGAHLTNPYHHLPVNGEMRMDLTLWQEFLSHPSIFSRSFFDFDHSVTSQDIMLYTDASKNKELGCGGFNDLDWFILQWDEEFIEVKNPSINYLNENLTYIGMLNNIKQSIIVKPIQRELLNTIKVNVV